jgi:hypothetical protein
MKSGQFKPIQTGFFNHRWTQIRKPAGKHHIPLCRGFNGQVD